MRHCPVFLCHEFRERALYVVRLRQWTRSVTNRAISAHCKSGCPTPMEFCRFSSIDFDRVVISPCRQSSDMSLKGSAVFRCQSHHLKFGNIGVLAWRRCWGGLRASASARGLFYPKGDGCSVVRKAESGRQFCSVSGEEVDSQEKRDRRERRLWAKALRKNIYESLRKDRITVELFPELSFALDGNYYPKLVPFIAQKINSLLEKDADDEIAELLDFLGVSLNPHLVGEVLNGRDDWEKSLRFFIWAKCQPEYEHSAHSYNRLLCNLAKAKSDDPRDVVVALDLLQEMVKKGLPPSTCAANIVIDRLCKVKKTKAALKFMRKLESNGVPLDLVTYNSVIHGLGRAGNFEEVFELLEEMEQKGGMKPDLRTYNSIIHSLGNSERWQEACKVFDELSDRGLTPDVVTYNSLINGLYKCGQADEAFKIFGLMSLRGCEPDVVTFNSLIHGLAKASRLDDALKIFNFMKQKNCIPNVCTYNTLIGELISRNKFAEVSGLLLEMKEIGCTPDKITHTLLMEIGQVYKISAVWRAQVVTDAPAENEDGSCSSNFAADNGK